MNSDRQNRILEMLSATGFASVDMLVEHFNVTPQSIRRDLRILDEKSQVIRTHGGVKIVSGIENISYEARLATADEQKKAIGFAVAALIPDNASLFVNIGTTTEAAARALGQHEHLLIVTNNMNVASLFPSCKTKKIIITSGEVRGADGGVLGESTVDFIGQFKLDFAVIGASAISADGSLLDYDYREVKVTQAIIKNADHVILATDSQKYDKSAPVRIGHISQVNSFVTDCLPSSQFRDMLSRFNVRVVETS